MAGDTISLARALEDLVGAVCHVGDWPDGSRVGAAIDAAELALASDAVDVCDECGRASAGPGDAHRVSCDCGAVVCSACCRSHGGESYCPECADDRRGHDAEQRALAVWHGAVRQ